MRVLLTRPVNPTPFEPAHLGTSKSVRTEASPWSSWPAEAPLAAKLMPRATGTPVAAVRDVGARVEKTVRARAIDMMKA